MENVPDHENSQQQQFQRKDNQEKNSSFVIRIPSYDEVAESSQPKTTPSLFNPSSSFAQAFNFIKNTEFYTAPPPPPPSGASNSRHSPPEGPFPSVSESAGPSASVSATASPSTSVSGPAGVSRNSILVSHRQKGNPLLKHIRNVRWVFADLTCDFLLGQNACALYLSLRYHLLHPDYLYFRIRELQKNFKLRLVLCHVDVEDVVKPLLEVTKTAILHDCTLLCAWSLEECGRYLETIKVYENKPADLIQGQMDMDYQSRLNHALTSLRQVNKTDVVTLGSTFGSLSHIMDASMEDLARCPGIGERKVKGLYDMFHEPFKRVIPPPNQTSSVGEIEQSSEPIAVGSKRKEKGKKCVDTNKHSKKEAEMSIKSSLEAAFAKLKERKNKIVATDDDDDFV